MLQLNIKSKDYMCLDIDPDSVIHKHIHQKILDLDRWHEQTANPVTGEKELGYHNLTMLYSFHISLEEPNPLFDHVGDSNKIRLDWFDVRAIIGEIALADIHISKKDGKKSAWIPLHPELVDDLLPHHHNHRHYARPDDPDAFDRKLLHISLANLTGNPRDSIARPEDCIIDTITT